MNRFVLLPALAFGAGMPMLAQQSAPVDDPCCSAHAAPAKAPTSPLISRIKGELAPEPVLRVGDELVDLLRVAPEPLLFDAPEPIEAPELIEPPEFEVPEVGLLAEADFLLQQGDAKAAQKELEKALKEARKALEKAQKDLEIRASSEHYGELRRRSTEALRSSVLREAERARERAEGARERAEKARERSERRITAGQVTVNRLFDPRIRRSVVDDLDEHDDAEERDARLPTLRFYESSLAGRSDGDGEVERRALVVVPERRGVTRYRIRTDADEAETFVELNAPRVLKRILNDGAEIVELDSKTSMRSSAGDDELSELLEEMRDQMAELRGEMRALREELQQRRGRLR